MFCISAPKMFRSLQAGEAVTIESTNTIASGLAAPFAGKFGQLNCASTRLCEHIVRKKMYIVCVFYIGKYNFEVIRNFVENVILVSDEEIKRYFQFRVFSFVLFGLNSQACQNLSFYFTQSNEGAV